MSGYVYRGRRDLYIDLVDANRRILEARDASKATAGGEPAPEFEHLTHGTMTAYKHGCRCEKCWRRNYERGRRQRQARRQREAGVAA